MAWNELKDFSLVYTFRFGTILSLSIKKNQNPSDMQVHKADGGGGVIWGWATVNGLKCAMIGMNTEKVLTRPKTMGVWRESENRYIY